MELEEKLEQDLQEEEDFTSARMLNLPSMLCYASNGDVFFVDTKWGPA